MNWGFQRWQDKQQEIFGFVKSLRVLHFIKITACLWPGLGLKLSHPNTFTAHILYIFLSCLKCSGVGKKRALSQFSFHEKNSHNNFLFPGKLSRVPPHSNISGWKRVMYVREYERIQNAVVKLGWWIYISRIQVQLFKVKILLLRIGINTVTIYSWSGLISSKFGLIIRGYELITRRSKLITSGSGW